MNFKDHFSKLAANYASFRPHYPAALFDYLAQCCPRRDCVWDCACGSGQATLDLAARFDAVTATDASAAQIAAAAPCPNVRYRVAPADASGLAAASVDLVTVAQALHWFDLAPFYAEVRRVLRPQGILAVWTYGALHVEGEAVERLVQEFYWHTIHPYWPPERRHVESGYRDLAFAFAEMTAPDFAMQEKWSLRELIGYIRSWSATARYVEGMELIRPRRSRRASVSAWGASRICAGTISWPLSLRIGVKS